MELKEGKLYQVATDGVSNDHHFKKGEVVVYTGKTMEASDGTLYVFKTTDADSQVGTLFFGKGTQALELSDVKEIR